MKLNNHGWGFKAMLFYLVILIIFLFMAAFLIIRMYRKMDQNNFNISEYFPAGDKTTETKKETLLYSDLEVNIKNATVVYIKNYYDQELSSEKVAITLDMLKDKGVILELNDIKDKTACDGYVLVAMNKDLSVSYDPYIKCANYTTNGYIEDYN
ncbi:MAG TPA: hypothetical protein PLX66_01250 [Bacilli bacterium]|nr:hypothetical protein [Bacilli bacterium]